MSHYSYKKKAFLGLPNNLILPLCLYADSSLTTNTYDRHGRKHTLHPKHWCVNTLGLGGILVDKQKFDEEVNAAYEREMQHLEEFRLTHEPHRPKADKDSRSYYGTVYPSGGKMKDMKSFYSTKHLIDAEDFVSKNHFNITISTYDTKTYNTIHKRGVYIDSVEAILKAHESYIEMKNNFPNEGICIGVYGLEGSD